MNAGPGIKGPTTMAKRHQLKALNREYTECLSKDFIPRWLNN